MPRALLTALGGLLLTTVLSATQADGNRPENVDDYLQRCAAHGWSGSAIVIHEGKTVLSRGYGMADRKAGRAIHVDTLFEIASLTKPLTAMAVMALVEDGTIELDTSISEYLPGVPESRQDITVRDLLCHSSGMPRAATGGHGEDLAAAVAGYLAASPSRARATKAEYWNGGYALLAGIVQETSGVSFPDFCRERLFRRARLKHAGFTGDALAEDDQAIGYASDSPVRHAAEHPYGSYGWQYQGMGGAVMSAAELLQFIEAYDAGKILKKKSRALMETEVRDYYGLGWVVGETGGGERRISHGGDVRGFHVQLMRYPDDDSIIILMSNVEEIPMWKLAWNVEALLFDMPLRTSSPPALDDSAAKRIKALLGRYSAEDGGDVEILADMSNRVRLRETADSEGNSADNEASAIAKTLFDAVTTGDSATIAQHLGQGIPSSWPSTLCRQIWPDHVKKHSELRKHNLVSLRALGAGRHEVHLTLSHERGEKTLRIVLNNGRLQIFDLNAAAPGPLLATEIFAPIAGDQLIRFDWQLDRVVATYTIEVRGRRVIALHGRPLVDAKPTRYLKN